MIKLFNAKTEIKFELTVFPDKTSQVWKLDLAPSIEVIELKILWLFENESELVQLLQLAFLLKTSYKTELILKAPYLPYARQDKEVSNTSTWALQLFAKLIKDAQIDKVEVYDQHSHMHFHSESAEKFHNAVINHDFICFPDKGARTRYPHLMNHSYVYCEKIRNQSTGEIIALNLETQGQNLLGKKVIIVDDLCDGGKTFTEVAKKLKEKEVGQIDLAVSHGIFSKGKEVLHRSGIQEIFTTNSLIQNPDSFKVW